MESWGRLVTYMTDNPACLASARPMEAIGPTLQMLLRLSEQPTFVSQQEQALLPCSCLYQVSTRDCKDSSIHRHLDHDVTNMFLLPSRESELSRPVWGRGLPGMKVSGQCPPGSLCSLLWSPGQGCTWEP